MIATQNDIEARLEILFTLKSLSTSYMTDKWMDIRTVIGNNNLRAVFFFFFLESTTTARKLTYIDARF